MNKKVRKYILIGVLVIGLTTILSGAVIGEDIADFILVPENPAPKSNVTFYVNISGENISSVNLTVEECSEEFKVCFSSQEVQMDNITTNKYVATVTLKEKDATYIKYFLKIITNGIETNLTDDTWRTDLSIEPDTYQSNGTNGENGTSDTPGFELILLVVSVIFVLFLFKRKE